MARLETSYSESRQIRLALALFFIDGFTRRSQLVGLYDDAAEEREDAALAADRVGAARLARHTTVRVAGRRTVPRRREDNATFLFLDLPPGSHTFEVRSPYYEPRDLTLNVPRPDPRWPAFPDITLADETLPLDSPAQPAAYRAQRSQATLQPTPRYPFPAGATLVRGTVSRSGQPLGGATVRRLGDPAGSITGPSGEYVLFFTELAGSTQTITLEVTHPLSITVTTPVTVVRGLSVLQDIPVP